MELVARCGTGTLNCLNHGLFEETKFAIVTVSVCHSREEGAGTVWNKNQNENMLNHNN